MSAHLYDRRRSDSEDNYSGEPVRGVINGICTVAIFYAIVFAVGWILVN